MEFSSSVEMFLITRNPLEGTKRNFIMKRNRNRERSVSVACRKRTWLPFWRTRR